MMKSIIKSCAIAVAALCIVSCSKRGYVAQTYNEEEVAISSFDQIYDSLRRCPSEFVSAEIPLCDSAITHSTTNYYKEIPDFTSSQSSNITLDEYKSILHEDIVLSYSDMKAEFRFPLDSGYVTSPYGWRKGRMHTGVDIKAYRGDNIYAVFDGVVRMSRYYSAYGNVVVIRHYNGLETVYSHASKLKVKVNDHVKAGDIIALAGRTGRATGDHLHFEVRVNGQYIDPNLLLDIKNLTLQEKSLYITMRSGRLFASNNDSAEARQAEIKEALSMKYHTVKSGDTLSRIAANNRTTITNLCKLNGLTTKSILRIGQRIRVR